MNKRESTFNPENNEKKVEIPGTLDLIMIDGKYAQVIFQDNVNQGLTSMKIRFLDSPDKLVELASENLREYDFVRAPMRHQAAGYLVEDGLMEEEMLDNLHYTASENDRDSKRMINFFGTYTKNK